jgi:hypothetical protein
MKKNPKKPRRKRNHPKKGAAKKRTTDITAAEASRRGNEGDSSKPQLLDVAAAISGTQARVGSTAFLQAGTSEQDGLGRE